MAFQWGVPLEVGDVIPATESAGVAKVTADGTRKFAGSSRSTSSPLPPDPAHPGQMISTWKAADRLAMVNRLEAIFGRQILTTDDTTTLAGVA